MDKIESFEQVIILYTYRYIWKDKNGKLCVKYLTEPQEGHRTFQERIKQDSSIVSCVREYIHEVNFRYLGFTEPVKNEEKEGEKNETLQEKN